MAVKPYLDYALWYARILSLLPASYLLQFGEEMQNVFTQLLADAGRKGWFVFGRECCAFPVLAAGVYLRQVRRWLMVTSKETRTDTPSSWVDAWLAALPMLGIGLMGIVDAVSNLVFSGAQQADFRRAVPNVFAFIVFLGLNLGILAGGLKGFPRWSYSYAASVGVIVLYLIAASLAGVGTDFLIPLGLPLLAVLIPLVVRRSWRPLGNFFIGMWRNFPRATFAFYCAMPFLCWLALDEMDLLVTLLPQIMFTIIFTLGVLVYMRTEGEWRQMLVLLGGMSLSWFVITAAVSSFWHLRQEPWMSEPSGPWYESMFPMLAAWLILLALTASPALMRVFRRNRPA
jgi:hypothetical protein